MIKLPFFLLVFLFNTLVLSSQTLTGAVYDEKTKTPVSEATVYLDGTFVQAKTDSNGAFKLKVDKVLNTSLIITHLAYNTTVVPNPFSENPDKIYLTEKDFSLEEAVVVTDRFTREQKLKAFRDHFLGKDKTAKLCKILNEDDIRFSYSLKDKTLTASCHNPIRIENNYLGYSLEFNLMDFSVSYGDETLNTPKRSLFLGTSLFTDIAPDDKKFEKRRADIYNESKNSFFKNLTDNMLERSKWRVLNKSDRVKADRYFGVKDTLSMKLLCILPGTDISQSMHGVDEPVVGNISVLYNKNKESRVIFFVGSIWVDQYGNTSDVDKILYTGDFAEQRIAKMLPLDFTL